MRHCTAIGLLVLVAACGPERVEERISGIETGLSPFTVRPRRDALDPSRIWIPGNLREALDDLRAMTPPEMLSVIAEAPEGETVGPGGWLSAFIRTRWRIFEARDPSPLRAYFVWVGVWFASDIERILLVSLWRDLNGRPIDLDGQVRGLDARWCAVELPLDNAGLGCDPSVRYVAVKVDAAGRTRIKGREFDFDELRGDLYVHAETQRDEAAAEQPSLVILRLWCDPTAPWKAAREVLRACADPAVRIRRVFFAVRHPVTAKPGFLAVIPAIIVKGGPPLPAEGAGTAYVEAGAATPVGEVVTRVVDALKTGARRVVFRDAADPASDFLATLGGQ